MPKLWKNKYCKDPQGRPRHPKVCSAVEFAAALSSSCNWFSGVPDSVFRKILPRLKPYVAAPRENHAIGMAFGTRLGGKRPCVLMQNSGLGLSGDALYGLFHLYRLGVVLVVSQRGELKWEEPQHSLWGQKTLEYLSVLNITVFDLQKIGIDAVANAAKFAFTNERPAAILLHRGNIDE